MSRSLHRAPSPLSVHDEEAPTYAELHKALHEELSPSRKREGKGFGCSPTPQPPPSCLPSASPEVDAAGALEALLQSRNELAKVMRQQAAMTRIPARPRAAPPPKQDATPLKEVLKPLIDVLSLDSSMSELTESLPPLPSQHKQQEAARIIRGGRAARVSHCVNHVLGERPWLEGRGMSDGQAAAAAHLLLYAEGLQGFRALCLTDVKKGRDVVARHPIGDVVCAGASGTVVDVRFSQADQRIDALVDFEVRLDGSTGPLLVHDAPSTLFVRPRRIIPVEALERYGKAGAMSPSVAAHTVVPSRATPPSLGRVADVLGVEEERQAAADCFTTRDLTFYLRETEGGITMSKYRSIVGLVGKHTTLIRDAQTLSATCTASLDRRVSKSLVLEHRGQTGRVIDVDVSAESVAVTFPDGSTHWVPLPSLTAFAPDPLSALGCRNTSISVLGNPSPSDISAASRHIATML